MDAIEEQTRLITYIDSVIQQLNRIKEEPIKEIEKNCFTLSCIAWSMEMLSVGGIRTRRRGRLETDSDSN